ncbi:hypothetical protein COV21_00205 [Candidatus Woesearchaeota archaeon CG10_big_fil_rev_8_21_14_0_10_45_5]|nr:MAG: hypothetical protein COV21_00205 [Candidatus Woesearchaeota archaeon CG10_big_fil_rev_8_21_14_0_10_45_5]
MNAVNIRTMPYKKVVWQETPESVRVIQGLYSEDGDFVRVRGDYKDVLIRKDKIISIEHKQARGVLNETRSR